MRYSSSFVVFFFILILSSFFLLLLLVFIVFFVCCCILSSNHFRYLVFMFSAYLHECEWIEIQITFILYFVFHSFSDDICIIFDFFFFVSFPLIVISWTPFMMKSIWMNIERAYNKNSAHCTRESSILLPHVMNSRSVNKIFSIHDKSQLCMCMYCSCALQMIKKLNFTDYFFCFRCPIHMKSA